MDKLLQNAVESIQLGVEDYQANDTRRPLSAARNFFAGVLLLAKHTLIKAAPNADPDVVIGAKTKPVSDGAGGVRMEVDGSQTVDFGTLGKRLEDFNIKVDQSALRALNKIRNDIEHRYTNQTGVAVKEAIAKAFPVVADLCRELGEVPTTLLGDTWATMLSVKGVYERELAICRGTFAKVNWTSGSLEEAARLCPSCGSALISKNDPHEASVQSMDATCQSCGVESDAEALVEHELENRFANEGYLAVKDGGEPPLHHCPACSVKAYITYESENACAWCEEALEECCRCGCRLTPDDVSFDDSSMCSYCAHLLSKDD